MKILRFIIYGLMGWCLEIFWTGIGSLLSGDMTMHAWTSMWMFLIYGLAILMEPIHNVIRHWPILIRGGIYAILILVVEFCTGSLLRLIIGACPWYYDKGITIAGITRLDYAPFWFIAGLLFEKLHDELVKLHQITSQSTIQ